MLIAIMKILRAVYLTQCRRLHERRAAAHLHALSDYALRDLGVARSQIDQRVRFPARRYVWPRNSNESI